MSESDHQRSFPHALRSSLARTRFVQLAVICDHRMTWLKLLKLQRYQGSSRKLLPT
jgi:hypothetical protein